VANYTNNGTFAPGLSPGTLNVQGDFTSTATSILEIELDGLTPDTEHDVLAIDSNANLNGTLDVILGFAPQLDDEFVIITAGAVTECNLPAQVTTMYTNDTYTFDVVCNADNVTLRVSDVILTIDDNTLGKVIAYPNPTDGEINIDLGQNRVETAVTITNILGQVVAKETFRNTAVASMHFDGTSGLYFALLQTEEGASKTIKIMKK